MSRGSRLRDWHEIPSVQEAKADEAKGEAKSEALPCRAKGALGSVSELRVWCLGFLLLLVPHCVGSGIRGSEESGARRIECSPLTDSHLQPQACTHGCQAADKKDEKKARMPVESGGCTAPAVIASDDDDDDDVDHGDGEDDDDGLMMLMMMMMMIVMMMMMMMMMMLMLMVVMMVVVVMMMLMKMTPVRMAMMMMKKKKMRTRMKIVMVTMILPTVNTILIINILSDGRAN